MKTEHWVSDILALVPAIFSTLGLPFTVHTPHYRAQSGPNVVHTNVVHNAHRAHSRTNVVLSAHCRAHSYPNAILVCAPPWWNQPSQCCRSRGGNIARTEWAYTLFTPKYSAMLFIAIYCTVLHWTALHFSDMTSRPARSQGLLYKQPCHSLIHSVREPFPPTALRHRHAQMVRDSTSSYKIDYTIVIKNFLNPEGHQNPINGSKVTVLLLNAWILPIGEVSSGKVCACSLCSRLV